MAIRLTVDGHPVEVEPGATILDAAGKLGVDIPTLCHLDGLEPSASCFLCLVQVEGRDRFVPSCTARAEQGMVVTTDSDAIRRSRRAALELLLSDHRGDCVAPCSPACPAGLDIPGFIAHTLAGRAREAVALIKERIPLPAALGRICPRYCERVCRRRESEEAIAICALKRFAADVDLASEDAWQPAPAAPSGKRVAVVGAGPAGLAAVYYLLRDGHDCVVYDAHPEPGGMLRYAVPEFRLPRAVLRAEIDVIRRLGARFVGGTSLGSDVSLGALRKECDAVLLTLGAGCEGPSPIDGAQRCASALPFLAEVAQGNAPELGDEVIVLGGGSEAVDCARTALRSGACRVTIVWEKTRPAMPCFADWVDDASAEGVELKTQTRAVKVAAGPAGRLQLTCVSAGAPLDLQASSVISAPRRQVNQELLERLGLATTERGIKVVPGTFETSLDGVFAAGDCVSGPAVAVRAVASGRQAARCISQCLAGQEIRPERRAFNVRLGKLGEEDRAELLRGVAKRPRVPLVKLPPDERRGSHAEVESGLSREAALCEAQRCLQCDCLARDECKLRIYSAEYEADPRRFANPPRPFVRDDSSDVIVYEPGKCILCGLCVRIAANRGERIGIGFSRRGYATHVAVPFGEPLDRGLPETMRICAEACPTGALALRPQRPGPARAASEDRPAANGQTRSGE